MKDELIAESRLRFRTTAAHLITIAITNRQKTLPIDRRRMRRAVSGRLSATRESPTRKIGVAVVDDADHRQAARRVSRRSRRRPTC